MPRESKGSRVNRKLKPQTLPDKFTPGFTAELDNRTLLSRALRQRFEAIAADLGGDLSNLKASLLERCVWLEALMCRIEGELATADDPQELAATLARWIQLCNAFQGIAAKLGLERVARDPWAALHNPPASNGTATQAPAPDQPPEPSP